MWDNEIRDYYLQEYHDSKHKSGPLAYINFLNNMQTLANSLYGQNKNVSSELSLNLKKLLMGTLKNYREDNKIERARQIANFLADEGKPITKYLDEYNWITITKKVAIPPAWHPKCYGADFKNQSTKGVNHYISGAR
jgi:hypothetical protein